MVFSITRYTFTTRNHWLLNCIAKKHSPSAPEKRTLGACRTESAVLDWITKPFYVFPLRIQLIFRTQFRGIRAFYKRKGPAGEVGNSSYTKPSVFHSNFPECRLHSVWTKSCLLACNLNSVRIVHYQIFDVHKKAVVQMSISPHVHGSFKVFLESLKGGNCIPRSLQWHVQFIANLIL